MKEALQTEYEKGRFDMREEMMKDAVDATILDVDAQTIEFGLWPEKLLGIKEGDKVKIIIVKEEQQ
jgi:Cu/Ag efflux protein CusF